MAYLRFLILFLTLFCPPVLAQEGPNAAQLSNYAERLAEVDAMDSLMLSCPAEVMGTRISRWRRFLQNGEDWSAGKCRAQPDVCATACLERAHGAACRSLARVLELAPEHRFDSRRAYTLACALGDASGCTNRAAGLRNSPLPQDHYSQRPMPEKASCLAQSFAASCAAEDAWGCAMQGQALWLGEGVAQDLSAARRRLNKACALSTETTKSASESAPCRFANSLLEELNSSN